MFTYDYIFRRTVAIAPIALAAALSLIVGEEALTVLAEGFGWLGTEQLAPTTHLLAEGFGWDSAEPGHPEG